MLCLVRKLGQYSGSNAPNHGTPPAHIERPNRIRRSRFQKLPFRSPLPHPQVEPSSFQEPVKPAVGHIATHKPRPATPYAARQRRPSQSRPICARKSNLVIPNHKHIPHWLVRARRTQRVLASLLHFVQPRFPSRMILHRTRAPAGANGHEHYRNSYPHDVTPSLTSFNSTHSQDSKPRKFAGQQFAGQPPLTFPLPLLN
jgi:hypothetical protein